MEMEHLDDSENRPKIPDSAYANSCNNSQSRRSHSSKSTHSGSHSSGSSGYGGQPSSAASSNDVCQQEKKEKDPKKKKVAPVEPLTTEEQVEVVCRPPEAALIPITLPVENVINATPIPTPMQLDASTRAEDMDITASEKNSDDETILACSSAMASASLNLGSSRNNPKPTDGFSCVVSMQDGVVMYSTVGVTVILGYPKDMWIGRSFIEYIHPKDEETLSALITSGLASPKHFNSIRSKAVVPIDSISTMVCRVRKYRGLFTGFGIKARSISYIPFHMKLGFKNVSDEDGNVTYLVIHANAFFPAYKFSNELLGKPVPFVIRHSPTGIIEYIDPEAVPYLGYLPQELTSKDILQMYHPQDLEYLKQVYETLMKDGGFFKSKQYRFMTQNGDYIKVETEWSAYIDPWSKKLQFVSAKHFVVEGPTNPEVFKTQTDEPKIIDEEKNDTQDQRDGIIKILTEVMIKPLEPVKQHMSKRCQDVTSFMESLIEEPVKTEEELRLDIQDTDNSCYERDSVMLGGISPHHEYDSKSSTETPLSYNQLNFQTNLQRYFDSHQPYSFQENAIARVENNDYDFQQSPKMSSVNSMSPMATNAADVNEQSTSQGTNGASTWSTAQPMDTPAVRLTEPMINKHNADMERELMKTHRENRSTAKCDREKTCSETKQKKKEHLARCNASFLRTDDEPMGPVDITPPLGLKRPLNESSMEEPLSKQHCPPTRETNVPPIITTTQQTFISPQPQPAVTSWPAQAPIPSVNTFLLAKSAPQAVPITMSPPVTVPAAVTSWPAQAPIPSVNTFLLAKSAPQAVPITMSPPVTVPGITPKYYTPTTPTPMATPPAPAPVKQEPVKQILFQQPAIPRMPHGRSVSVAPFVYPAMAPQLQYPMRPPMPPPAIPANVLPNDFIGLGLFSYEEAYKTKVPLEENNDGTDTPATTTMILDEPQEPLPSDEEKSWSDAPKSMEAVAGSPKSGGEDMKTSGTEENVDKADDESNFSSFNSSFFKTESGSAEDSNDARKSGKEPQPATKQWDGNQNSMEAHTSNYNATQVNKDARRKMDPPWMQQVCVTSDLIYKYQIHSQPKEEVLLADKEKIMQLEQPSLVNEQLEQLYLDLQLEGVTARLTLEEGITSSNSSGDDVSKIQEGFRRRRAYSNLVMIYEEDAPLPSPGPPEDCPEA